MNLETTEIYVEYRSRNDDERMEPNLAKGIFHFGMSVGRYNEWITNNCRTKVNKGIVLSVPWIRIGLVEEKLRAFLTMELASGSQGIFSRGRITGHEQFTVAAL
jgi:hypothetical protein